MSCRQGNEVARHTHEDVIGLTAAIDMTTIRCQTQDGAALLIQRVRQVLILQHRKESETPSAQSKIQNKSVLHTPSAQVTPTKIAQVHGIPSWPAQVPGCVVS